MPPGDGDASQDEPPHPPPPEQQRRPDWGLRFATGVALLRAGAHAVPRHIPSIRFFIDRSIPGFLLPPGVDVATNVTLVPPESGSGREAAILGETFHPTDPGRRSGVVVLYAHGGAYC